MGALALVTDKKEKPAHEPTALGRAIRTLRKEKGLRQRELAEAAGCELQYVSGLETGNEQSRPATHYVDAWARKLGVPENRLRDLAGHPRIVTPQEQSDRVILDYYEGASEASREIMRAVLQTIYEVDKRRQAEGVTEQPETSAQELEGGAWPGAKDSSKKASKKARHR